MKYISNAFVATVLYFAYIIVVTTEGTIVQQQVSVPAAEIAVVNVQEQENMRPGGYSPVDMSEPNPRLLEAANYAMQNLPEKYTFASSVVQDRTTSSSETSDSNKYSFQVIQAFQQVVAGMNYKIIITITDNNNKNNCIGAFAVTVYDQFGTLSVTTWGKEISCSDVETIRLGKKKQEKLLYSIPYDSYFND